MHLTGSICILPAEGLKENHNCFIFASESKRKADTKMAMVLFLIFMIMEIGFVVFEFTKRASKKDWTNFL